MRRSLVFLLVLTLAVALADGLSRAPEALARLEVFRVVEIQFDGGRYLTREEALQTVAVPIMASVWDDAEEWEDRLRSHPLVRDARIQRRFPGTLVLNVEEREPVALYPNPLLEPVDESGAFLPIDPTLHRLDVPLMASREEEGPGSLTPAQRRLLAGEIARIGSEDPEFLARVSEITLGGRDDLQARLWDPPFTMHFRPGLPGQRIRDGLRVLRDAMAQFEGSEVVELDLRYDDQVVLRLNRAEGN